MRYNGFPGMTLLRLSKCYGVTYKKGYFYITRLMNPNYDNDKNLNSKYSDLININIDQTIFSCFCKIYSVMINK